MAAELRENPKEVAEHIMLVDLARKHRGPESYAANHESNSTVVDREVVMRVSYAADPHLPEPGIERWTAFHGMVKAPGSSTRMLTSNVRPPSMMWKRSIT